MTLHPLPLDASPDVSRGVIADSLPGEHFRDAVLVLAGVALIALFAQVTIPMQPVPITGQTFAVGLVGAGLGSRRGLASVLLYVCVGLWLPVYADGASGLHVITGASGGYLLGFIPAAACVGWLAERGSDRRVLSAALAFAAGQLLVFVPGLLVLHLVTHESWSWTVDHGFTVFIVGGAIKAVVAALIFPSAWHLVRRVDTGRPGTADRRGHR
jgi:biotin transport system substrate-specific component